MAGGFLNENWFSNIALQSVIARLAGNTDIHADQEYRMLSHLLTHLLADGGSISSNGEDIINFFCSAYPRRDKSFSQIAQDLWGLYQTKDKRDGYFVEFGACDGLSLSNTLLLERDYGWQGVLAEPDPRWVDALKENRTARISTKCVYSNSGETIKFDRASEGELSRISDVVPDDIHERNGNRSAVEVIEVETISMLDLLKEADAPKDIDYISVDTEGSELKILEAFDFSQYRIKLITVEHAGEEKKREGIFKLLNGHGFRRFEQIVSKWDDWYILEE